MSKENGNGNIRRLPLWKGCLEEIIARGVDYGSTFEAQWFEEQLDAKRDSRQFGLAVHKIRVQLEERGFYLQGHAQREGKLVILPIEKNLGVARGKQRRIRKDLRRAVSLLNSTDVRRLKPRMRVAFEKETKRAIIKQMLLIRAGRVARVIEKAAPKLLER